MIDGRVLEDTFSNFEGMACRSPCEILDDCNFILNRHELQILDLPEESSQFIGESGQFEYPVFTNNYEKTGLKILVNYWKDSRRWLVDAVVGFTWQEVYDRIANFTDRTGISATQSVYDILKFYGLYIDTDDPAPTAISGDMRFDIRYLGGDYTGKSVWIFWDENGMYRGRIE